MSPTAQAAGKFVPSHYVKDVITLLFVRGAPITSPTILLNLTVVSICSIAALLIGIVLFKKYGKT